MPRFDWLEEEEGYSPIDPICDRNGPILPRPPRVEIIPAPTKIGDHLKDRTITLRNIEIRCRLTPVCESPIEIDLGAALIDLAENRVIVEPQLSLGHYRFDFGIRSKDGALLCIIECDGKEFHSTPEQIKNDAAKNRFAASIGVALFRFTGQEIYQNPYACAAFLLENIP